MGLSVVQFATTTVPGYVVLAGDLNGTGTAFGTPRVGILTGVGNVCTLQGTTALVLAGANPATTGDIRAVNATTIIAFRNAANSADLVAISTAASNNITFGNASFDTTLRGGSNASLSGGSGLCTAATAAISISGTNVLQFGAATTPAINQAISTTGAGVAFTVTAQAGLADASNRAGGMLQLRGGARNLAGLVGGVRLEINGTTTTMVEAGEVITAQRIVALVRGAVMTTTEMPANTGDLVVFLGNAATAPTANSVSGVILYAENGAAKCRGTGGTITTYGPAELDGFKETAGKGHCPSCGTDFAHEWQNDKYGALTVCMKCLTDEIGERPWIVRRERAA